RARDPGGRDPGLSLLAEAARRLNLKRAPRDRSGRSRAGGRGRAGLAVGARAERADAAGVPAGGEVVEARADRGEIGVLRGRGREIGLQADLVPAPLGSIRDAAAID